VRVPIEVYYAGGAHWRHLANAIEPSGGNAALDRITYMTTCYNFKIK